MTSDQRSQFEQRRTAFDQFFNELMPVLVDVATLLELRHPPLVLTQAESFLPQIDEWLQEQEITSEDRAWIVTRLGYFVGEVLVQKHGGCWSVCDQPESRFFARYVVSQFRRARAGAVVDPFECAIACCEQPAGRSLSALLQIVEKELLA